MSHSKILILDFGSQVTQLIARRVREAHVFCEVHPCDVSSDWVREYAKDGNLKGIILSGSHASVYEVDDRAPDAVFQLGIPVLGICYGMQTMAEQLGGKVEAGTTREFGYAEVRAHGHTELLKGIEDFATAEGHGMTKSRNCPKASKSWPPRQLAPLRAWPTNRASFMPFSFTPK